MSNTINKPFIQNYNPLKPILNIIDFESIKNNAVDLVEIECRNLQRTILHGEIVYLPEANQLLFIGNPFFQSIEEIEKNNIEFEDLSFSDSSRNLFSQLKKNEVSSVNEIRDEKYRSIISNMNLGLVEVDLDEKILYTNQSFNILSGYNQKELLGKKANDLFVLKEDKAFVSEKNERRKENISDAYELKVKNKKGEYRWWLVSGAPSYNDKGELIGSIGIHLDITKQKKLEIELIKAREHAEQLAKIKENFLANMSHEIRTPMNAIIGMSNQLMKSPLSKQQQFYVEVINSAADNLMVIINDILDISKIEAGKLSIENIGFELRVIINKAMQVMMHKIEEKGLFFTNSFCDVELSPVLLGDPYRLNQVLLNLISNAIKFTYNGGVDIRCEKIKETDTHQIIKVSVKDTGIGMDKIFVDNLFNKFSQEYESITREYGGTGLGMSISKQLVELMGGEIFVESEKGKGTTVYFIIDFAKGTAMDLPIIETIQLSTTVFEGKKILVVDDNELNRLVASTILNNFGVQIFEAASGGDAIKIVQNNHIDLILMDIQMPGINGIEATKIIRQNGFQIPIIALTANAIKGESEKCLSAGMNDYISKPFKEENFLKKIAHWFENKIIKKNSTQTQKNIMDQDNNDNITPALYDLSILQNISRGNDDFIKKMIAIFCDQTPIIVKEMIEALQENDLNKIRSNAHKMKPSIDNLNIQSLKETIRTVEMIGKENNNITNLPFLINNIDKVIKNVITQMQNSKI